MHRILRRRGGLRLLISPILHLFHRCISSARAHPPIPRSSRIDSFPLGACALRPPRRVPVHHATALVSEHHPSPRAARRHPAPSRCEHKFARLTTSARVFSTSLDPSPRPPCRPPSHRIDRRTDTKQPSRNIDLLRAICDTRFPTVHRVPIPPLDPQPATYTHNLLRLVRLQSTFHTGRVPFRHLEPTRSLLALQRTARLCVSQPPLLHPDPPRVLTCLPRVRSVRSSRSKPRLRLLLPSLRCAALDIAPSPGPPIIPHPTRSTSSLFLSPHHNPLSCRLDLPSPPAMAKKTSRSATKGPALRQRRSGASTASAEASAKRATASGKKINPITGARQPKQPPRKLAVGNCANCGCSQVSNFCRRHRRLTGFRWTPVSGARTPAPTPKVARSSFATLAVSM